MLEKTPSLKKETKLSNIAKNVKFTIDNLVLIFKIRICQATLI